MPGWMKGKFDAIYCKCFVPTFSDDRNFTQTVFYYGHIIIVRNILFVAPPAVVCMAVGYDAFVYGAPCIYVHISLFAVNSFVVENEKWLFHFSFSSSLKIRKGK